MSQSGPGLPYQPYRSKRHSHTPSNSHPSTPTNVSAPPISRPPSVVIPKTPPPQPITNGRSVWEEEAEEKPTVLPQSVQSPPLPVIVLPVPAQSNGTDSPEETVSPVPATASSTVSILLPEPASEASAIGLSEGIETDTPSSPTASQAESPGSSLRELPTTSSSTTPAVADTRPTGPPRKVSTFRRIPRNSRGPLPPSPLAEGNSRTLSSSSLAPLPLPPTAADVSSSSRPTSMIVDQRTLVPPPPPTKENGSGLKDRRHSMPLNADAVSASLATHPARSSSLAASVGAPISRVPSSTASGQSTPSAAPGSIPPSPSSQQPPPLRPASAPYRPGFQPKGVYRPRTDEFVEHRKAHAISAGYASAERTKLERRLEKLVHLHFPEEKKASTVGTGLRPGLSQPSVRRASSFFDLDLKGILSGGGAKDDLRAAEQRLTPWQDDSSVSKCPLCLTGFHPLTVRKHHCRLCGKIICALPIKRPQRPEPCSILFVVDPKTRNIEEVGEGVDYGVKKRRTESTGGAKKTQDAVEEEKFLRGVRICKDCRPVLLREQYHQQNNQVPMFVKLYEAFLSLEKEIEEALPQFQELILSLNQEASQTSKEATAARKRLLEAFAQYDALSKRIRALPTPNGKGSSQERVQIAVMTRANFFLQKNMFPLQSLPTPKRAGSSALVQAQEDDLFEDPSSATALALQPLLEQEALLENYVEEAKAQRKFEDAKTLRQNLGEIRQEIERVLAAEGLEGRAVRRAK